jgi:hypothetical protein
MSTREGITSKGDQIRRAGLLFSETLNKSCIVIQNIPNMIFYLVRLRREGPVEGYGTRCIDLIGLY